MIRFCLCVFTCFAIFSACSVDQFKAVPTIEWEVVNNMVNEEGESLGRLTIRNTSEQPLPSSGWALYFNTINTYRTSANNQQFDVRTVNGDLRVVTPLPEFKGLEPGQEATLEIYGATSVINSTDAPLGFYIVVDNQAYACQSVLRDIQVENTKRKPNDIFPVATAASRYENQQSVTALDSDMLTPILPKPVLCTRSNKSYSFSKFVVFADDALTAEAINLKNTLAVLFSGMIELTKDPQGANVHLRMNPTLNNEAYTLMVDNSGIVIESSSRTGAFYGVQSLLQLLPLDCYQQKSAEVVIQGLHVEDYPRFQYRGIFLDVARNFHTKDEVIRLLDIMASYKLNKFHFHICDDEGWRVEIEGLPELTTYGSKRCFSPDEAEGLQPCFGSGPTTNSHGTGHYTKTDFIEILKYAHERHIEVIPEIDMPGHARAAIMSMKHRYKKFMAQGETEKALEYMLVDVDDQSEYTSVQGWTDNVIDVSLPSTYKFLEKVTDEMLAMYKTANVPLTTIHTGGDEVPHGVWEKSPTCIDFLNKHNEYSTTQDLAYHFVQTFGTILSERGLIAAGWEEIALTHGETVTVNEKAVGKNLQPYVWNSTWNSGNEKIGYQLANAGFPVVFCNVTNLYFDLAYSKAPEEVGYYWGNFVDTRKTWEYTPMNIPQCASIDLMGQVVDIEKLYREIDPLTAKGKKNVLGIQGLLWSENALGRSRVDYLVFPKLLGLAERAWSPQPEWAKTTLSPMVEAREADWNRFVNRVGQFELKRLDHKFNEVLYRIAPPGATIVDGKLHANVLYPGLRIFYEIDGSEPTSNSPQYTVPINIKKGTTVKLCTSTTKGRLSHISTIKY